MPIVDYVIEAMKSGKTVAEIIKELMGKKISADERWYIDKLLEDYQIERQTQELRQEYRQGTERIVGEYRQGTERIVGEYRQGTERILNHLTNLEKAVERYYGKIEGLVEGLLLGKYKEK